jgi:hypothetical protein
VDVQAGVEHAVAVRLELASPGCQPGLRDPGLSRDLGPLGVVRVAP